MNTSRHKGGGTVSNRQVGYGLVFGVPKSLSIYLAITGDPEVENIARSAVDETMRAMESEMQCKVRKGGVREDRRRGELVYSKFFHRDSRPIGGLSDPQEDLKAGRLQAAWEKLEQHRVVKEVTDSEALRERAVEQHLKALRAGKTSLMISPRHEEARKVASVVRERLKTEGAIGLENYPVSILRRMDLGPDSCRDLLPAGQPIQSQSFSRSSR
jgi:hypothetical protein